MVEFLVFILIVAVVVLFYITRERNNIEVTKASNTKLIQLTDTSEYVFPELAKSDNTFKFEFLVRQWRTSKNLASINDKLFLHPEPTNSYDKNAVAVFNQNGFFGYVAQEENSELSKYLIDHGHYFAQVRWTNQDEPKRYLIEFYSTKFISKSHGVLRNPELTKKSHNIRGKYKFKNTISEEDRLIWLEDFKKFELEIDEKNDSGHLLDDLENMISNLLAYLETGPNRETSEELFSLTIDYITEIDILIKSKGLNNKNKEVARQMKKVMEMILKKISE